MMQKLDVDCEKQNVCELGNDMEPEDKECGLNKGRLLQILKQLEQRLAELKISTNTVVYLCRCDKPQKEPALPPCGRRYIGESFDLFLLIRDKRGRKACIWIECRVGENVASIVSRLVQKFNRYRTLGNGASQACCGRGAHASVLLTVATNVSELKKRLRDNGLNEVLVVGI